MNITLAHKPATTETIYYFINNAGKKVYSKLKSSAIAQCRAELRKTRFTTDTVTEVKRKILSEDEADEVKKDSNEYWVSDLITVSL